MSPVAADACASHGPPRPPPRPSTPRGSLSAYEYLGALYNRLVKLDQQGTPVPDLAEEWSANADGTEWTFALRRGVVFHDGSRFTADDAIASIRHILDEKTGSPQAGVLGEVMDADSMRAVDPYTLRFSLTKPNAEFPSLLTAYQCYIVPADAIADIGRTGIGTGPFRLSSFTPPVPAASRRSRTTSLAARHSTASTSTRSRTPPRG